MANIRLIHWNGPEGRERKLRLASLGHHVEFDDVDGAALMGLLRRSTPDAYVIDLSRLPSGGRTVAMWLRTNKATRHIPIVFVDGEPAKVKQVRQLLPDATFATWPRLKTALPRALAKPVRDPVVPPSSIYTGRSTAEKLGIKAAMRVAVVSAPPGFTESLKAPDGVMFTARPTPEGDLFVAFARTRREVIGHLTAVGKHVSRQTLWLAWPKRHPESRPTSTETSSAKPAWRAGGSISKSAHWTTPGRVWHSNAASNPPKTQLVASKQWPAKECPSQTGTVPEHFPSLTATKAFVILSFEGRLYEPTRFAAA